MGHRDTPTRDSDPRLLFVYGTLRRGSDSLMADRLASEATFVGEGTVAGVLYDTGRFPGCVPSSDPERRVHGEVFALHPDTAAALIVQLDQYEGYAPDARFGSLFVRTRIMVRFDDDSEQAAWIYHYNEPLGGARVIPSGDWMQR